MTRDAMPATERRARDYAYIAREVTPDLATTLCILAVSLCATGALAFAAFAVRVCWAGLSR